MKHISILACILVVCFVSTAWAQHDEPKGKDTQRSDES